MHLNLTIETLEGTNLKMSKKWNESIWGLKQFISSPWLDLTDAISSNSLIKMSTFDIPNNIYILRCL